MPRPAHFEIHASDPEKLVAFYSRVFDWKFNHLPHINYWLIDTGPGEGINGGLLQRTGPVAAEGAPVNCHVVTMGVPSLDEYLKRALDAGATIALAKMAVPGIGWQVYVKDPDGNILGIHQQDPSAK